MSGSSSSSSSGIGFTGMLTTLFIALKLTGVIAWSWLWVLSPIWIATSLIIVGVVIYVRASIIIDEGKTRRRQQMHKVKPNEKRAA